MVECALSAGERREMAFRSSAWPFAEARGLWESLQGRPNDKGYVLFETGYGPSGLPHIGTFGEVVRTTMVRHAFSFVSDLPTRLFTFSDDMDGLRKVPDNVPNQRMLSEHLGKPLTAVPDPFGTHESFGHHNNARLRSFLDQFGFEYEFMSATECYKSGRFDAVLLKILAHYDEITHVILPTLGDERRETYSPFLPICRQTGRVLQARVVSRDTHAGTIVYEDEAGKKVETPVTGGSCKLQWKVDWAMRWLAFDVDYEMAGKDLIDSVKLSGKICRILGGKAPGGLIYELFLDERGEKISKSKGNGLSVEEWLRYAPHQTLALFMYHKPRSAKKLYFDVIPRTVDDYLVYLDEFPKQEVEKKLSNPVWHIHGGHPPEHTKLISYSLLLNLASVCHAETPDALWFFISRYFPSLRPGASPIDDALVDKALIYYRDFVMPRQVYRAPTPPERDALKDLAETLGNLDGPADAETIQEKVYQIGKRHPYFGDLKAWFKALYQILLGQDEGPRMGSFIAIYGIGETIQLIDEALQREPPGKVA